MRLEFSEEELLRYSRNMKEEKQWEGFMPTIA